MGFHPGLTQVGLYSHRSRLEALNFGFKKKRDCTTIFVGKTRALISCVDLPLCYAYAYFTYAEIQVSHDAAHFNDLQAASLNKAFQLNKTTYMYMNNAENCYNHVTKL